jgi:hypothetical protein
MMIETYFKWVIILCVVRVLIVNTITVIYLKRLDYVRCSESGDYWFLTS